MPNQYQTILMFWAVMVVCMLVNIFGAKYLDVINKICIYWTSASIIIILVTLLSMADSKRSGTFVFGHYDGPQDGLSSSDFSKLHTPSLDTEWSLQCVRKFNLPNTKF